MNKLLLSVCKSANDQLGKVPVLSPSSGNAVRLYHAFMHVAAASICSLMKKMSPLAYTFSTVVDADSPKASANSTLRAGVSTTIFGGTNDSGFLVQANRIFSLIGFTIDAACSGLTIKFYYYNGTAYVEFTPAVAMAVTATGDKVSFFIPPADWVPGTTAAVGGVSDKYSILVIATTAGATAVTAADIWACEAISIFEMAAAGQMALDFHTGNMHGKPLVFNGGESLVVYNSGAHAKHAGSYIYDISQ